MKILKKGAVIMLIVMSTICFINCNDEENTRDISSHIGNAIQKDIWKIRIKGEVILSDGKVHTIDGWITIETNEKKELKGIHFDGDIDDKPVTIVYMKIQKSTSDTVILTGYLDGVQEDFQCDEIAKIINELISDGYVFAY